MNPLYRNTLLKATFLGLFLLLSVSLLGQPIYKIDLNEALRKAEKENKNLIVYRYDSTHISYYKTINAPVFYHSLDSIVSSQKINESLSDEFIVHRINANSKNNVEIDFYNNYFRDPTPNLIIFSPYNFTLAYLNVESLNLDFINNMLIIFKNRIVENYEKVLRRNELEAKFNRSSISNGELLELVRLRTTFRLKSKSHLNYFALSKGVFNDEYFEFFSKQNLKTTDPFVNYFLKYERESNSFLFSKIGLINDLLKTARKNNDKIEFENSLNLQLEYNKKLYQNTSELSQSKYAVKSLNELLAKQNLTRFDFYSSISDTLKIIENGLKYCNNLVETYKEKQEENIKFHIYYPATDSSFLLPKNEWQKQNIEFKKKKTIEYDEYYADLLNNAAWIFYLVAKDVAILKNALKWSKFSIKLNSTPEKFDTYAHLLFVLGQKNEAINFQKKAIEGGVRDKYEQDLIDKMKLELLRFQSK